MAWTSYQIFLAFMMLITGSINTLSTKWADNSESVGIDDGAKRKFVHPFLQASGMFLGELSCLLVFHLLRICSRARDRPMDVGNQSFNPMLFLPAALCDMLATSTMYLGLNLTYASSFQMLRGAVIIFTALLSVIFLRSKVKKHMWLGIFVVVCGLILVGVSDIVFGDNKSSDRNSIIAGDLLIIMAQIITAAQMVYEQKYVTKHNIPPLQAVGWEGFFGFFILGTLIIPMYYIPLSKPFGTGPPSDLRMENALDAFKQMQNNHWIILAVLGNIVSIAFFNFSGISVTKELNATTRMVLDSCRTLVIWVFSLSIKWQPFQYTEFLVQAVGFLLLICGMCLYNDIIFAPFLRSHGCLQPRENDLETLISNTDNSSIQDEPNERTPILDNSQYDINAIYS